MKRLCLLAALILAAARPAVAVQPDELLDDPAQEQRARVLSRSLRCVICQSENIDESNVDLARDMRLRIRELISEGYSDAEVTDFMVHRYGDFVLMRPPVKRNTYVLWFGPAAVFAVGAVALVLVYRRRRSSADAGADPAAARLSDEERQRLQALLGDEDEGRGR